MFPLPLENKQKSRHKSDQDIRIHRISAIGKIKII